MSKVKMYHATDYVNLYSIIDNGILKGNDGLVFLAEKPEYAIKFLYLRNIPRILVCEVEVEETELNESFDHNEAFFKCKAFTVSHDISTDDITNYVMYDFTK